MKTYSIVVLAALFIINNSYSSESNSEQPNPPTSAAMKRIITTIKQSVEQTFKEAAAKKTDIEAINTTITTIQTSVTKNTASIKKLTTQVDEIKTEIEELTRKNAHQNIINTNIQNDITAIVESTNRNTEHFSDKISQLIESVNNIEAALAQLVKDHSEDSEDNDPISDETEINDTQEVHRSPSAENSKHEASQHALEEIYIKTTNAMVEINSLKELLLNTTNALDEKSENDNQEKIAALIELCNKVETQCQNFRNSVSTPSLDSQLYNLAKTHAIHLDSLGSSCMLCYLVWKILEKPNKILPRISVETKQPIIELCKNTSATAIFNALLNRVRGTSKNGWKCMSIFAGLDIIAPRMQAYLEQHIPYSWLKKPGKNKTLIPYISWIVKSSIAHLLA